MDSFMGFFVVGNIGQCNCKLKQTWKETCDSRTGLFDRRRRKKLFWQKTLEMTRRVFMHNRELEHSEVERDLSVFVDEDLKFESHVNETVMEKANKIANMITH